MSPFAPSDAWPRTIGNVPLEMQLGRFQVGAPDGESYVCRLVLVAPGEVILALPEAAKKFIRFYPG